MTDVGELPADPPREVVRRLDGEQCRPRYDKRREDREPERDREREAPLAERGGDRQHQQRREERLRERREPFGEKRHAGTGAECGS